MNRLFLLLFGAVSLVAHAQVPDYVPTEGLVAWYPFNGNANDESGNGYHGEEYGISYVDDRFNGSAMAIACGEPQFATWVQLPTELETTALDFTFSFWIQPWSIDGRSELISRDDNAPQAGGDWSIHITDGVLNFETRIGNEPTNFVVGGNVEANAWSHVVINRNASQGENLIFLNGAIVAAAAEPFGALSPTNPIHIGRHAVLESLFFRGDFDDFGFWNRALTEEEILGLYNAPAPAPGCTDSTACNFDFEATSDDGSCIPSGCTEEAACNFNPDAGCDDESCAFDEGLLDCDAFGFELDSLVVCFGAEVEVTAPIANSPEAPSGTAEFIDEFYLDFGGPSSHTLGDQPSGSYQISVSGTWCGGSCWNGHTSDAAYSFNHPYGNGVAPYGGNSFTINEYCPQDDNSCELIRPEPDEYNPDHIYTYLFEHPGGELMFYGLADECCWGDNQAGLSFSVSLLPTSPCVLDYSWNNGANEASIVVEPQSSGFLDVTVISSTEQCIDSLWIEVINQGCSDADACNFNPSDLCTVDCIFPVLGAVDCEHGAETCGEGTIWNSETQTCVPEPVNPTASEISCGPGTYWDDLESLCLPIETCNDDLDGDGVIGINDLMQLLSSFGTMCEDLEPETGELTCGDPVSYHGYDYATVQIGEQCWFAENLRTELYRNGDFIPANLSDSEWSSTASGAVAVYGEDSGCESYSPDGDACDPAWSLNEYGRLYNWYAVDDARGLCPSMWHVPTDEEWIVMSDFLGGSSVAGYQMKTNYGWYNGGSGSNSIGYAGLASGFRRITGSFDNAGISGNWWSSSLSVSSAWYRDLDSVDSNLDRGTHSQNFGFSVRCIKDTE